MHINHAFILTVLIFIGWTAHAKADDAEICTAQNSICVLETIKSSALAIENKSWRDQSLRELAKTYAALDLTAQALAIIPQIQTPDTQAMTIRGIGMEAAKLDYTQKQYDALFASLREQAETIEHPPSYAIALTYISMAQAFADDDEGAWKTAASMKNDALRNKAYAETAEIQAENGNFNAAMKSIGFISTESFRNKAYAIVSKLLADRAYYNEAYNAALEITNAYKRAQSIQHMMNKKMHHQKEKEQLKLKGAP